MKVLQSLGRRAQKAESLCDWQRRGRKTERMSSLFDTEPAIRSRYVWALDVSGQTPMSPK
jgi:hypothetical protein